MFTPQVQSVIDRVDALRDEVDDHWQIPAEQGLVLAQIVRIGRCRSACEIGVSYGFSTLHLAAALAESDGRMHAVDRDPKKVAAATKHLTEAGLADRVTIHEGDALDVLPKLEPDEPFDFLFIDATKGESIDYFEALRDKLAARCVIAADNTGNLSEQMQPYVEYIRNHPGARSCEVPFAHGFELTVLDR